MRCPRPFQPQKRPSVSTRYWGLGTEMYAGDGEQRHTAGRQGFAQREPGEIRAPGKRPMPGPMVYQARDVTHNSGQAAIFPGGTRVHDAVVLLCVTY